jgi:outer membrane protein assembly factor BamA
VRRVQREYGRLIGCALHVLSCAVAACLLVVLARLDALAGDIPPPDAGGAEPNVPAGALSQWLNPSTAPFIPIPLIGSDPNSGTTLGLLPVWIKTDDDHEIRRIIAPDVLHNPYFGYGVDARVYAYSSKDEQWSIDSGIKERVERDVDAEYQIGRLRDQRWSLNYSLIFDRSGTPRFYGVGNESPVINQTNYTNTEELAQVQVGLNLTHVWQILYTGRFRSDDVTPGTLAGIASLETRFGRILGVGTNNQLLNRLSIIYDTRDDLVVPSHGMEWVAYGGGAARHGILNESMYSEAGLDGRDFWPVAESTILAAHVALRYLRTSHEVPFWALSSLGGGVSQTGGAQPLRGYGEGRFYDRNSFSTSVELRRTVLSFDAVSTRVDVELAPFVDIGRVFARANTNPFEQLHHVFGVGFRGIAKPFVVGKVDIGYGSDGVAVFTGLNYPF